MPRLTIATLVTFASVFPAMAQDFNATPPHGRDQTPAFNQQTRAPILPDRTLKTKIIVDGLENPWGMVQLPNGAWLVTERPGRMRCINAAGVISEPIKGLPEIDNRDQGGLLDVAINDDFKTTRQIWWSFAQPQEDGKTATAVGTGILSWGGKEIENARVIWQQKPAWDSTKHYGSRLIFDNEGGLFVTTGERSNPDSRVHAQNVATTLGKVVRIDPQTGEPMGRPGVDGALPEIWSWGHRNIQGATLAEDGTLWTIEHGPKGGDELNHPQPGRNYGWPLVTYGIDYSGEPIGKGITQMEGTEQPVYYWDPVIAPGGMTFYHGDLFPEWKGDLLISGLKAESLVRLEMKDGRVTGEARHLQGIGRVRDVEVAADGSLMILMDHKYGAMVQITPGD